LAEVLVTLALTSLAITFAYTTLTYVQKLFFSYKTQNRFITEYVNFKNKMQYESLNAQTIIENAENKFTVKRDSSIVEFEILEKVILLKNAQHCDTFHIEAKKIKKEYEPMTNAAYKNKLLNFLSFEMDYTKQKFNFYFYKNYDASIKLKLDKTE